MTHASVVLVTTVTIDGKDAPAIADALAAVLKAGRLDLALRNLLRDEMTACSGDWRITAVVGTDTAVEVNQ